ncbi:hypothetical protein N9L68_02890 [bacterium]|nr:hypothetical protein [bacterium]
MPRSPQRPSGGSKIQQERRTKEIHDVAMLSVGRTNTRRALAALVRLRHVANVLTRQDLDVAKRCCLPSATRKGRHQLEMLTALALLSLVLPLSLMHPPQIGGDVYQNDVDGRTTAGLEEASSAAGAWSPS